MKEIWKLIELLNEYGNEKNSDLYYKFELKNWELYCYDDVTDVLWTMQDEAMVICSKKFWFIKWLVDNDKIDKGEIPQIDGSYYNLYDDCDNLLMNLSIQDEPIRFLCEIIK
jgi:hypothetical protein